MHPNELNRLVEPLLRIARSAGEQIMAIYNAEEIGERLKADQSPFTLADLAAHKPLLQIIRTACEAIMPTYDADKVDQRLRAEHNPATFADLAAHNSSP